ncbi:hypothetical protein [Xenophilus sp. Marseille-Q4582]|uniref:hypothetical protein n=1 Tax=Xenophilus sp. Marseille-Q4582 TaxID=2866600 RepID=UPI001CE42DB1|nr:hypothetical protein [Xenophilus sp. Marseille-Q4582]
MNPPADGLSPQQKLAQSRQRLLDAMGYVPMVSNISGEPMLGRKQPAPPPRRPMSLAGLPARLRDSTAAQWAARWWSHHPLHDVADLGRPYLQDYAERHPARLMAYSAGVGAVLWLVKPWRLISTAALLSLTLKAGTKGLARAALTRQPEKRA